MINIRSILLSLAVFFLGVGVLHASPLLSKNLFLGVSDSEVSTLQAFLNKYADTRVSSSGPGSSGFETTYFGQKTKDAVIRFQNKFKDEILVPNGLLFGNGFVGEMTRGKINSLLAEGSLFGSMVASQFKPQVTTSVRVTSANTQETPVIVSVSPDILNDGDTLVITGRGFTNSNKVFLGIEPPDKYSNIVSTEGGTKITLQVKTMLGDKIMTGLQKNIEKLSGDKRNLIINKLLTGYRKSNNQKETGFRTMIVPTAIRVDNENGKSNTVTGSINIFKEIF